MKQRAITGFRMLILSLLAIMGPTVDGAEATTAVERLGRGVELLGHYKDTPTRTIFGDGWPTKIEAVAFLGTGGNLAAITRGGDVCVWDRATSKLIRSFSHFQLPEAVGPQHGSSNACFSQDGKFACIDDCFGDTALWDVDSGKATAKHNACEEMSVVCSIAISPDTKQIALAGFANTKDSKEEGTVALWNPQANVVRTIKPKNTLRVCAVAFQPNGPLLAVNSLLCEKDPTEPNRWAHSIWNVKTAKLEKNLPYEGYGEEPLQFDRQGQYLVSVAGALHPEGGMSMVVRCWDVKNNRLYRDTDWAEPFSFSPNSLNIVVAQNFSQLVLINLKDGSDRFLVKLKEKERPTATRFSSDGKLLLVGTIFGNVFLFRIHDVLQDEKQKDEKAQPAVAK